MPRLPAELPLRFPPFAITLLLIATCCLQASGGAPSSNGTAIRQKREAIATEIDRLSKAKEHASPGKAAEQLEETLVSLQTLDALYAQCEDWLEEKTKLEARLVAEKKELEALDKFVPNEPAPYSLLLLERLKDEQLAETDRERGLKAILNSVNQLLKAARHELDRNAHPAEAKSGAAHENPATTGQWSAEKLPGLIARANVATKHAESQAYGLQLEICQIRKKQLAAKISVIGKDTVFSRQDLTQELAALASKEADLRRQFIAVGARFKKLETSKKEFAQKDLDNPVAQNAAASGAWRVAADAYQAEVMLLDQRLDNLDALRSIWKRRYELVSKPLDHAQLLKWRDEADALVDRLKEDANALTLQHETVQVQLASLTNAKSGDSDAKLIELQREPLRELLDLSQASHLSIKTTQRSIERFREDLTLQLQKTSGVLERVRYSLLSLGGWEVASTGDRTVTAGQLLLLLAIIVAGTFGAYYLSRWIGRRVLSRFGISRGKMVAVRTIVFYVLCLTFGVIAFRALNIPLAAFAFVGGAAAIAIGFGSQDIMNNFMSGLILLTEQPIRVGDVIELGKIEGVVTHLGMRSTRLRTRSNHELIVPNKSLLDEQVTNFTLSNNIVRRLVKFTVERSIPIRQAKRTMRKIVKSHPLVLKSPRPVVLVKEIDNYYGTVAFEIDFALNMTSFMECEIVQSKILQRLAEAFPPASADKEEAAQTPTDAPTEEDKTQTVSRSAKLSDTVLVKELRKLQSRMRDR